MNLCNRAVHKYPLEITDSQVVETAGAWKPLCVQIQRGTPCIWAEVFTDGPPQKRRVHIFGTGHHMGMPPEFLTYIGTFQILDGAGVFHVYEGT